MKRIPFLPLALVLVTLTACSKTKEEGPAIVVPTGPIDKVSGLDVKGRWVSQCLQDLAGIPSRRITMEYSEQAPKAAAAAPEKRVTRTLVIFHDRYCAQPNTTQVNTGRFGYSELHADQVYTLEYWIDTGSGTYGIARENVKRDGNILYISDLMGGASTVPQIPLLLESGPSDVVEVPNHAPKAGDTVEYLDGGYSKTYSNQGDNQGDGIFRIAYRADSATGPSTGYIDASAADLWSTAQFKLRMKNCAPPQGVAAIVSVPAGKFETCRTIEDDGYVWYGNIPVLGIVKQQKFDGTGLMELKSYTVGN